MWGEYIPDSDYVVPLEDLAVLLTPEDQQEFRKLCDQEGPRAALDLLEEHWPATLPPADLFEVDLWTGHPYEDFYCETAYVRFDQDYLFTRTETPAHEYLTDKGIEPRLVPCTPVDDFR